MKDNIILKHFSSWQSEIDESLVDKKNTHTHFLDQN